MTVKNFLKTAVLGVAFCSVVGISNSISMDNNAQIIEVYKQQLRNIFYPIPEYSTEGRDVYVDLRLTRSDADLINVEKQAEKLRNQALSNITHVINIALYETLDITDLDILKDNIKILKTIKHARANSRRSSNAVLNHSQEIIDAVYNIYINTH